MTRAQLKAPNHKLVRRQHWDYILCTGKAYHAQIWAVTDDAFVTCKRCLAKLEKNPTEPSPASPTDGVSGPGGKE
jgi:hypothetical protein